MQIKKCGVLGDFFRNCFKLIYKRRTLIQILDVDQALRKPIIYQFMIYILRERVLSW